ncbi:hypothetical protein BDF19DRAFT_422048 [Syncephalis fuscata]|nr:hypothetical protein BDF19DRAFT_422048 [Syncephalis fuscata]
MATCRRKDGIYDTYPSETTPSTTSFVIGFRTRNNRDDVTIEDEYDDAANNGHYNEWITWEYHIVYLPSYRLPGIYFHGWHADGTPIDLTAMAPFFNAELASMQTNIQQGYILIAIMPLAV